MKHHASNATTHENPPFMWKSEPKTRGTFGILSLCLSTMIICVWTAVHSNIPTIRYRPVHRFFHRLFWMLIALIAPEALLCFAINQRMDAGVLEKKAMKYLPSRQLPKRGNLASVCDRIFGRATLEDVSNQYQAPGTSNSSMDFAGA